jgi:hypothetical protein
MTRISSMRTALARIGLPVAAGMLLCACAATEYPPDLQDDLAALRSNLEEVQAELTATREALAARERAASTADEVLDARLEMLRARLDALPVEFADLCPAEPQATGAEPSEVSGDARTMATQNDKLVVGEVERVWIEPPGASIVARVDTGSDSSSLHAEDVVEFERDGRRWVRFNVSLDDEVATIERPVKRFVRVYQQADPEGTRRAVVELRVVIGNVRENVEFTLADRSHLNYEMLLGRNFLTDVALVDVGKQFVQPTRRARRTQ